jgi:hypothetical protein
VSIGETSVTSQRKLRFVRDRARKKGPLRGSRDRSVFVFVTEPKRMKGTKGTKGTKTTEHPPFGNIDILLFVAPGEGPN